MGDKRLPIFCPATLAKVGYRLLSLRIGICGVSESPSASLCSRLLPRRPARGGRGGRGGARRVIGTVLGLGGPSARAVAQRPELLESRSCLPFAGMPP
ncbi:hypothetical protein [Xanthomonas theicola]|uniref:hypothetical protein n=1 Tax=Xanthomonas theicola TaxID=56464 RepID=UPI000FF886D2|nr:hypothetical protein [Xanthomonas theicola]